jgi:hypothetical protein
MIQLLVGLATIVGVTAALVLVGWLLSLVPEDWWEPIWGGCLLIFWGTVIFGTAGFGLYQLGDLIMRKFA